MARGEARAAARLAAVQALYQMELAGTPLSEVKAEFESHWIGREVEGERYNPADTALFRDILDGVLRDQRAIDRDVDATLASGWPLKRIEAILRAVLRAGTFELIGRPDVPARVVISEYVDVASAFVERDEAGMVNAVLDTLARKLRPGELDPPARGAAAR
ncbi:MAG TPA: transcription antitermination factor NusB [Hyphomicrobiales bacterium]|nr:transcription antitermination factor NusB [Hyphomicrobiales bacterium]